MVDLRWALTHSNNWISARLISQLGPVNVARTMHNFGLTGRIQPTLSLCLGPNDVSVKEMAAAYTAFANNGMRVDPIFVSSIVDSNGNIISEFTPKHTEVLSETAYYRILSMLLNVVNGGTARKLRSVYNLTATSAARPERPTITPTDGSWASPPSSWPPHGLEAKNATYTSIRWATDRGRQWHSLSTVCS